MLCKHKFIAQVFYASIFICFVALIYIWKNLLDKDPVCSSTYIPMNAYFVKPYDYDKQVAALPNLTKLQWPIKLFAKRPAGRRNATGQVLPLPPPLKPAMSRGQRTVFDQLLTLFTKLMFTHGYGDRFMLHGGTLLGSFRHHDMVPRDDDVDLLVDNTIRSEVQTLLRMLEPDYKLYAQQNRDKFYTRLLNDSDEQTDRSLSRRASEFPWGWPYLDIAYYETNSTHLWDPNVAYKQQVIWPRSAVFPLRFRPLGPLWFPTPNDIDRVIDLTFDDAIGTCWQHGYSHVIERRKSSGMIACRYIGEPFAFVKRYTRTCSWTLNPGRRVTQQVVMERLIIQRPFTYFHTLYIPIEQVL